MFIITYMSQARNYYLGQIKARLQRVNSTGLALNGANPEVESHEKSNISKR